MIFPEDQNGTLASIRLSEIVLIEASRRLPEAEGVDPATNWQVEVCIKGPTSKTIIGLPENIAKAAVREFEDAMAKEAKSGD